MRLFFNWGILYAKIETKSTKAEIFVVSQKR